MSWGVPNLLVGDGRMGITAELDAEVLKETYGMDVTIRFNSDRRSGEAWLVTDEVDGIGRNSDVKLRDVARLRAYHEQSHVAGERASG